MDDIVWYDSLDDDGSSESDFEAEEDERSEEEEDDEDEEVEGEEEQWQHRFQAVVVVMVMGSVMTIRPNRQTLSEANHIFLDILCVLSRKIQKLRLMPPKGDYSSYRLLTIDQEEDLCSRFRRILDGQRRSQDDGNIVDDDEGWLCLWMVSVLLLRAPYGTAHSLVLRLARLPRASKLLFRFFLHESGLSLIGMAFLQDSDPQFLQELLETIDICEIPESLLYGVRFDRISDRSVHMLIHNVLPRLYDEDPTQAQFLVCQLMQDATDMSRIKLVLRGYWTVLMQKTVEDSPSQPIKDPDECECLDMSIGFWHSVKQTSPWIASDLVEDYDIAKGNVPSSLINFSRVLDSVPSTYLALQDDPSKLAAALNTEP